MTLPLTFEETRPLILGCGLIRDLKIIYGNRGYQLKGLLTNGVTKTWEYSEHVQSDQLGEVLAELMNVCGVHVVDGLNGRMVRYALRGDEKGDGLCDVVQLAHILEGRYHTVDFPFNQSLQNDANSSLLHTARENGSLETTRIVSTKLGRIDGGTKKMRLDMRLSTARDESGGEETVWFISDLFMLDTMLRTLEVTSWEELKGRIVRIGRKGRRHRIVSIGHIYNPNKVVMKPGVESEDSDD
jgi:hypothetical protein